FQLIHQVSKRFAPNLWLSMRGSVRCFKELESAFDHSWRLPREGSEGLKVPSRIILTCALTMLVGSNQESTMSDVFHLGLKKADLQGATLAIVPGDPERVKRIAELLDNPVHLASHREFTTWRGEMDGKAVIICSTGIGGPSTSIAV